MDEFLELGTEYRYHLIDDLPGKVVGAFIQDPRRLCYELRVEMLKDMLSLKKFNEWLNKSDKGHKISYYRGFLFAPNEQKLSPTLDFRRVEKLAKHIRDAYDRNLVTLVQKRHDDFDYEYIAVRK